MIHHVIFPVLRGSRRFFVQKGRRWSVVEHLLLDAVAREAASAADLASACDLPRRVVVEAFVRLMRASWVEIIATPTGPMFRATALGLVEVAKDQLKAVTVTKPFWRSFAIEQVTGGVFRGRELDVRPFSRLPRTNDEQIVIDISASPTVASGDLSEVFSAIEDEDEIIVGVDKGPDKLTERFAVVTVRNGNIEGLPGRANPALRLLIAGRVMESIDALAKAKEKNPKQKIVIPAAPVVSEQPVTPQEVHALYDSNDLILDSDEHSKAFDRALSGATERIIIHSTFISEARNKTLLPAILRAADKGTRIDILWGQDDIGSKTNPSRDAALALEKQVSEAGRQDSITVHPFSTNSHAKILVSDNGKGGWEAIVGSCNWLASNFSSFETSVKLRDPRLVGDLTQRLASLDRGRPGLRHDLAIEMTILGRRIAALPRGTGRTVPMRILLAADHPQLVLEARDRAKRRIFATSHRLGIAGRPISLLPIMSAVKANNISALAYYGRTTGVLTGDESASMIREFRQDGVVIRPVHKPRLHAKVLGWDDNLLAVSSFNWLSADPPQSSEHREIGVFIDAPRIADNFLVRFENARLD
jgi:phosphatidylserine/phosphatidylglycerophosphate/cardiolipin synthase-like enzyme